MNQFGKIVIYIVVLIVLKSINNCTYIMDITYIKSEYL